MFSIGLFVGLGVYLLYLTRRCTFRVPEGHVGILTTFGAAERISPALAAKAAGSGGPPSSPMSALKALRLHPAGLHLKWPWQVARSVSLMEEIIDLSGETGARTVMACDGTVLRLDSVLRYMPVREKLYDFVFDLQSPREHVTSLFTCLLRNEIANFSTESSEVVRVVPTQESVGGSYALLRRERGKLNREIRTYCQDEIGTQYGLRFSSVDLVDIRPPEELDEALNAAHHAQMEAEEAYAHAEAVAQRRIIAAMHGVEIAKTKASANEQEIDVLTQHLEELDKHRTLDMYVARRNAEVLSQAHHHYIRKDAGR